MRRRRFLGVSVKLGILVGVAAFAGVFLQGMFRPGPSSGSTLDLGGIPAGAARLESWNGRPVWVVHRSDDQLNALATFSDHVSSRPEEPGSPGRNEFRSRDRRYGIYLAATSQPGVLVQYLIERPDGLADDIPWRGGFVDPGSGALFDVAGRRYRTTPGSPLTVPPHRYLSPVTVRLGEW